ncbi:putative spermatogenesis-associated protein 17 isoform X2 [Apostichopus japonicus]|uniref:Putative spermatogenesis-associated protein 17 isoform X2 n=1 Tax=Stichopus japonicus TaxID=307972 RepID=A0A2G8JF15_STIJA|nr:putative spermatogenesis-associated protein 17 isoform X2 [Apostichopus japonicus]
MASHIRLQGRLNEIMTTVFQRNSVAEEKRSAENQAAVTIQAWFRAVRVQNYICHLHQSATLIQKHWRGHQGRRVYRILIRNLVFVMRHNYFNAMATKIQKMWRGFYVRKYVFDYYSRKQYLEGLIVKNEIIRREIKESREQKDADSLRKLELEAQRKLEDYAAKHRYLLSTEVVPGIYNSPFKPYPDEMEFVLRKVKPHPPEKAKPKRDNRSGKIVADSPPLPLTEPLPPIGQKLQGPFRAPGEVQMQRFKPFQPTLRVATSYTATEEARAAMKAKEWVMRVNDNIFEPFSQRDRKYEPLLHTTSNYGHLQYGTRFFRETAESKNISHERFQPVVSPIPVFDKLNDTYSKGTETVP